MAVENVMNTDIANYNEDTFESIKQVDETTGIEYWSARDLSEILGYQRWENFDKVITRATASAENAGANTNDHFRKVTKMVEVGSNTVRPIKDVFLSRYACYVIAMNGDPTKREIAVAQAYFAQQTRRQELADASSKEKTRLEARHKLTESDKVLSGVAMSRGVSAQELALMKSQGDKRLFGGFDTRAMKDRLGIKPNKPLADHLPTVSLTAKQLANEMTTINSENNNLRGFGAIGTEHLKNNTEVRKSLTERGIKLENLPPEEDIKKVERRLKSEEKKKKLKDGM
jgi:DNA-damage-inducible protein D